MKKIGLFFILFNVIFANNIINIYTKNRYIDLNKYFKNVVNDKYLINTDINYYKLLKFNPNSIKQCNIITHFLICKFNKTYKLNIIIQKINLKNNTINNKYFCITKKNNIKKIKQKMIIIYNKKENNNNDIQFQKNLINSFIYFTNLSNNIKNRDGFYNFVILNSNIFKKNNDIINFLLNNNLNIKIDNKYFKFVKINNHFLNNNYINILDYSVGLKNKKENKIFDILKEN